MLNKLFEMENIKYVISVDDCFAASNDEHLRSELYTVAIESFENTKDFFIKIGMHDEVEQIVEMSEMGLDVSMEIQKLVDVCDIEELRTYLKEIKGEGTVPSTEKAVLLDFLNKLKEDGAIEKYITVASTHEAEKINLESEGMDSGAVLWFVDKSFLNAGEADDAGIQLAKNIVKRKQAKKNYVFMLTAIDYAEESEAEVAKAFDGLIADSPEISSFIYYLNKNKLTSGKSDRIAKSLAFGFKRKLCYELINNYTDCLRDSCDKAIEKLRLIDQETLNYVFTQKVKENGESYFDFFTRLIQIFHEDEYGSLLSMKKRIIASSIAHYEGLCDEIKDGIGNQTEAQKKLADIRKKELFDMHVNKKHCEISTGDIFKINSDYYILVSQACDTFLRKDGKRKLDKAILLKIEDNPNTSLKYELSCFCSEDVEFVKPAIVLREYIVVPFEILDLCVVNDDGKAGVDITAEGEAILRDNSYTLNFKRRYGQIRHVFKEMYEKNEKIDTFWKGCESEEKKEEMQEIYTYLLSVDAHIRQYHMDGSDLFYPINRVARLNEMYTIDLLKEYGNILSRIGHPFDYMKGKVIEDEQQ